MNVPLCCGDTTVHSTQHNYVIIDHDTRSIDDVTTHTLQDTGIIATFTNYSKLQ